MSTESNRPINLIEIRKARNGWVISCWMSNHIRDSSFSSSCAGYATYVCGEDLTDLAKTLMSAVAEHSAQEGLPMPPARELP
jgi:hypothetical protein